MSCIIKNFANEMLPADVKKMIRQNSRRPDVKRLVIMPDVHLSHNVCVGTVTATSHLLYPNAIGSDIGCGMTAVKIGCSPGLLTAEAEKILRLLSSAVPTIKHRSICSAPKISKELLLEKLSNPKLNAALKKTARFSLSTLGRGNHFIEFQKDQEGHSWLMIHSGSRTAGQQISEFHRKKNNAGNKAVYHLASESASGLDWLNDMSWAIKFARLNRKQLVEMIDQNVLKFLGTTVDYDSLIDCCHDHILRETHNNEQLWVHRKGANRLYKGETTIIAGSMGTKSYHVTGRNSELSLHSCSHGAGRQKSRFEARKSMCPRLLLKEMHGVAFDNTNLNRLYDDAPSAYKKIENVLKAQKKVIKKVRTLTPLISFKGTFGLSR